MADEAIARIERMKGTVIPADVDVVVTRDDGAKANDAVNTLIEHLAIAVIAVVTVTLVFWDGGLQSSSPSRYRSFWLLL